jgi:hypothetical protein
MADTPIITVEQIAEFLTSDGYINFWRIVGIAFIVLFCLIVVGSIIWAGFLIRAFLKERNKRKQFMTEGIQFDAQVLGIANRVTEVKINEHDPNVINKLGKQDTNGELNGDTPSVITELVLGRSDFPPTIPKAKVTYTHPVTRQKITEHLYLHDYNDERIFGPGSNDNEQTEAYWTHNATIRDKYVEDLERRNLSNAEFRRLYDLAEDRHAQQQRLDSKKTTPNWGDIDRDGYEILTPPAPATGYFLNGETMFIQRTIAEPTYDWTNELE